MRSQIEVPLAEVATKKEKVGPVVPRGIKESEGKKKKIPPDIAF